MIKKSILYVLMFLYVYQLQLVFLPITVNKLFGIFGMFLYAYHSVRGRPKFAVLSNVSRLMKPYLWVLFFSIVSIFLNGSYEMPYIRLGFSFFLAIFGTYPIALLFSRIYGRMCFFTVVKYFVAVAVVQMLISFAMFANSSFHDLFTSLIRYDEIAEFGIEQSEGFRLIGFGTGFFSSGIIHGFILIVMSFYYRYRIKSIGENILFFTTFFCVLLGGTFMARTTLVGACIAFFFIFSAGIHSIHRFFKLVLSVFASCVICLSVLVFVSNYNSVDLEVLSSFGFEMFKNYSESGSFESSSTNTLIDMYSTIPDNMKTWLIGDAKWMDSSGIFYYKHTDVGYLRNIFYFGVLGLMSFIYFQYLFLKTIFYKCNFTNCRKYSIILFLFFIILNLKGDADLTLLSTIFIYSEVYPKLNLKEV